MTIKSIINTQVRDNQVLVDMRDSKNQIIPKIIAKYYLDDPNMRFIMFEDSNDLMYYKNGIYVKYGESYLKGNIEKLTNSDINTFNVNEIINHIKRSCFISKDLFDSNDSNLINLANGLYDIKNDVLLSHTQDYYSFYKSDIIYDKNAVCPLIDKYISQIVKPKDISIIYEIIGYALNNNKNQKTAFVFEGKRNSSKSLLIKLIEYIVGLANITHVSPLLTSNDKFGVIEYKDKKLNVYDDLGNTPIGDTGVLKSLISGAVVFGQDKGKKGVDFKPNILCIFGTNDLPQTSTFDPAYAGRFYCINFPN